MLSRKIIFHFLILLVAALPLSADDPTFYYDASVHDPSVIKVGDRFYVYGSHGASAWTTDLMNWTQVAVSVDAGAPKHFTNWRTELSDLYSWTNATTLWAADVIQLTNGNFYYYYNVWTDYGGGYRAYMGQAVSSTIEGPYSNVGEVIKTGYGVSGFNAATTPNTIDPTLFRDEDDDLWMVYGSYSGGIFILRMNNFTGMPLTGQSWGVKILGGNHALIEGAFIEYHPDSGYYYLFVSYGGLAAPDGYQIRVFRATSPDGPYFDPRGTRMSTVTVSSARASIAPHGLKLVGNYRFDPVEGEPSGTARTYLSPGHNSVLIDPGTGKWFNFFHTRFLGTGEAHQVRVHQMFLNEDDWPVMAPQRYAGESIGSYTMEEFAGTFKVLNHGKDLPIAASADEVAVHHSTLVQLVEDGSLASVTGSTGTWSMPDDQNIRLTLDDVLYKGIVAQFWDNENKFWVRGFTALSSDGTALWGSGRATPDREGDLTYPDLAPVENMALRAGQSLNLTFINRADDTDLFLEYTLVEGPSGVSLNADTGVLSWTPTATQGGKIHHFHVRLADTFEPAVADQLIFSVYIEATIQALGATHNFTAAGSEGIRDSNGVYTGLTRRLSGTGSALATNDPNLEIDTVNGRLLLNSTQTDFNGSAGLTTGSCIGHNLSEFGYTGSEDFSVAAEFEPLTTLGDIDQVGVFIGTNGVTLTRSGVIIWGGATPNRFSVHTTSGTDISLYRSDSDINLNDGLTVAISRQDGEWTYWVDGVETPPTTTFTPLDSASDLTVGLYAINPLNTTRKTVGVKSFSVSVLGDEPAVTSIMQWRNTRFGFNPGNGIAGNNDDPDGDGLKNLLEYALGTDPLNSDHPVFSPVSVHNGYFNWGYPRISDPALIYRVTADSQVTGQYNEVIHTSAGESNLGGSASVEDTTPAAESVQRYFRLEVETVEE